MPLRIVIGIDYNELAFHEEGKSSAETYAGAYVFDAGSEKHLFNTGDPVADLASARSLARGHGGIENVYMSSTFDFFIVHSRGQYQEVVDADGYRNIEKVSDVAR